MSDQYVGEIRMFGGTFAPEGWAFCDGSELAISDNDVLFQLIGTTYGGDGTTTFGLPDLRGRVPMHMGQGSGLTNRALGEKGGTETVPLTTNQLPSHTHAANAYTGNGTTSDPAGAAWAAAPTTRQYAAGTSANATMNNTAITSSGGGQTHTNMLPFQAVNFIIALYGIYPSQS